MKTFLKIAVAASILLLAGFYLPPAFRGDIEIVSGFKIGPLKISLYGLVMATAILSGFLLASRVAPKMGFLKQDVESALPWLVVAGFLGARLYFVIFSWEYFRNNWLEILYVWRGGLSIYGGLLGGLLGVIIFAKVRKLDLWKFLDLVAVAVPLSQAIGRWGNFFNQEAFGLPTTLPWRLYIDPAHRPLNYLWENYFHPTFLYESLWDLAVFAVLLYFFLRRSRVPLPGGPQQAGLLLGTYLVLYSLGRFFIEGIRLDSFFVFGSWRLDQLVSLLAVAGGAIILAISLVRNNAKSYQ